MGSTVNGLPQGFTLDSPPQSQAGDLPQGFTLDPAPAPQRQVAAGQGAIAPSQVAAGQGATGPGDVLGGLSEWIDKQAAPFWDSADRAHDALQTALGHFQDHLKNLAAGVAGIKRLPAPAPAPTIPTAKPTTQLREAPPEIESTIQTAAQKYNLDPKLIRAVIQSESNFKPQAKGSSGEIGLMQLMPETRTTLNLSDEDAADIEKNVDAGAGWLRMKIDAHGGDVRHGLAAYNGSGPKAQQYAERVLALYSGAPAPAPAPPVQAPPGFILEPKAEDFAKLPADVSAVQKAGQYLHPAARVVGGMASSAVRVSMPYIAWQMYKKATGQPNELQKIPADAIKQIGILLAGGAGEGAGEAAAPEAEATEAAPEATEAAPKATPKQLGMGAIEGEYLPPEVRGQLPPGQYAQPPVPQAALPPGQYAPPAPASRLALPERASPIPLPETFPTPREPIIRTTPSEPLQPLRTTPEETPAKPKGRPVRAKPAAQPAAKAPEVQPAAERTAVGTEGEVKGMRLVQRGNKWYDTRTGEEYKWKVRTN